MTTTPRTTDGGEMLIFDTAALVLADLAAVPSPTLDDVRRVARQYPITDDECRRVVEILGRALEGRGSVS